MVSIAFMPAKIGRQSRTSLTEKQLTHDIERNALIGSIGLSLSNQINDFQCFRTIIDSILLTPIEFTVFLPQNLRFKANEYGRKDFP